MNSSVFFHFLFHLLATPNISVLALMTAHPLVADSLSSPSPPSSLELSLSPSAHFTTSTHNPRSAFSFAAFLNSTFPLLALGPQLFGALSAFLGQAGNPTVQNELVNAGIAVVNGTTTTNMGGAKCPAMSVIFAKGEGELGNVGILTGPPFFAALGAYLSLSLANTNASIANNTSSGSPALLIQGVPYLSTYSSKTKTNTNASAQTLSTLITSTLSSCPTTQLLVSGYGLGAQVVHLAFPLLAADVAGKVSSVVLFGDPMNGTALVGVGAERVLWVCRVGDAVCTGGNGTIAGNAGNAGNGGHGGNGTVVKNDNDDDDDDADDDREGGSEKEMRERGLTEGLFVGLLAGLGDGKGKGLGKGVGKAHFEYARDAGEAARFAMGGVAMLGISSASMSAVQRGMMLGGGGVGVGIGR